MTLPMEPMDSLQPAEQWDEQARLDYLQLTMTTGVGPQMLQRLLGEFGTAGEVLRASPQALSDVEGVGVALSRRIRSLEFRDQAEQTILACRDQDIDILLPSDTAFPRLLRELPDAPTVLYVRGSLRPTDSLSIAIVGTRGASQYGRAQAERFARGLARAGITIVSGLARGIDAAAHHGALEAEGRTLGVLCNGVSEVYPPQHAELGERITASGALVSEMPPGTKPKKGMFPQRIELSVV